MSEESSTKKRINLALFCSGGGSNAEAIMHRFARHPFLRVSLMLVNKSLIGAIDRANKFHVPVAMFTNKQLGDEQMVVSTLSDHQVDYIAMAGFLRKIPAWLIEAYPEKIVNIHPSLLPKFGGKGMYGLHVHRSVIEAQEQESGMTVHLVNQEYDKGKILYQSTCPVKETDTPEALAKRVLALEHEFYGHVIESYIAEKEDITVV